MKLDPGDKVGDWFFQECIEAEKESLLIDAIQSGQIGIEDRDCIDRTPLMVALEMGRSGLAKTLLRNKGARLEYHVGTTRSTSDYPESAKWRCFNFFASASVGAMTALRPCCVNLPGATVGI